MLPRESESEVVASVSLIEKLKGLGFTTKLGLFTLFYTIAVVLWGSYVKTSFNGDGCGTNWPTCTGATLLPDGSSIKGIIETSHRISSGLVLPLVLFMLFKIRQAFPKGSQARTWAAWSVVLTLAEGAFGAWLVKKGYTAHSDSVRRTFAAGVHLLTTFALLASLCFTVLSTHYNLKMRLKGQFNVAALLGLTWLSSMVLGITGAISALGTMLRSHDQVLERALQPTADYLDRLRVLHPMIAVSAGIFILLASGLIAYWRPHPQIRRAVRAVLGLYAFQMAFGLLNIWMKAPVLLQLGHLLIADIFWVVIMGATYFALAEPVEELETQVAEERPKATLREYISAYVALTKPRIISLLLFTTVTAMFAAARGWPGGGLLLAVLIGGYCSAGAANTINMVIDRDIDGNMERTSKRPTVTQIISTQAAMIFGVSLAVLSFGLLWAAANLLAAMMSLAGLLFYVVIYTMLLKRRTWQNIVWGGAAGCFPPLVGWAAVTNELTPLALCLFGIIFMWTPVHFWALALLIKEDYAAVGVPMLPVVRGDRATVVQITAYGVLTALVSAIPLAQKEAGWLYMGTIVILNIGLLLRCFNLQKTEGKPQARSLFKFSMAYLALLFLMVAVDRSVLR